MTKYTSRSWVLVVSIAVLLGAFLIQYVEDLRNLVGRWGGDFDYCYLVPFLFLYLVFSKRSELQANGRRPSVLGIGVLLFSSLLYLGGKLGSTATLTFVSIWVAVIGVTYLLFGWNTVKVLAFPFVVLAFMIPLPPFVNNLLTFEIKLLSSSLSAKMMQAGRLSVYQEGNIIDMGIMQLQVVDACSGLKYVYPLFLMGLVIAFLFHKRWWERGIIIMAAIPSAILANALRIAVTGFLAMHASKETAEGFFHGFSNWLIFMVTVLCLALLSMVLKLSGRKDGKGLDSGDRSQRKQTHVVKERGHRVSFLWIAAIIFAVAWGIHTNLAAEQIIQERKTFDAFPMGMGAWRGEKIMLRDEILESLWADDYIYAQFHNPFNKAVIILFVPYYEIQGVRNTAHSPVSCLLGSGYAPVKREIISREMSKSTSKVQIRQMVLEKNGSRLLSNYWFQQRGRWIANEYMNKWYLFWDSITKGRTDGALVRIEMPLREGQDVDEAQAVLDDFTILLEEILPEYVPGG